MKKETSINRKKNNLYLAVAVLVVASITFRWITEWNFEQTSILFVGLPAFITVLMVKYSKTPTSAYGLVFKVLTIFLLMMSIVLGEGVVCVIMTAPIFYGVAALIVFIVQLLKKRKKTKLYSIVVIPTLLIISQPFGIIEEPKLQTVETEVVVQNDVSIDSFNKHPNFLNDYPNFFKIGFPKPVAIQGVGTDIGATRAIQFESNTKGIGTLSLEVIERNNTSIIFEAVNDDTHINHWLSWKQMKVDIEKIDDRQTKITWTSQYQCSLGPRWYFEPLEEMAVEIMNKHLTNAYFNQQ